MHGTCGLNNHWRQCQAGLGIPVDLPMRPLMGQLDEKEKTVLFLGGDRLGMRLMDDRLIYCRQNYWPLGAINELVRELYNSQERIVALFCAR